MTLDIRSASIMEITALGKGGFCQVLDDGIIAKVVDKVNQITFAYGKDESAKGNTYEIRLYDNKAQLIDKIIMMSDKEILYGKDNANYIAIMNGLLGYDYIDQLFRQSNPQ